MRTGHPLRRALATCPLRPLGWLVGAVALLGLLAGCTAPQPDEEAAGPDGELVWVVQDISGGRQCETGTVFEPPETEALLAAEGVEVHETELESMAVCMACGCPSYAARHFARISADDLDGAGRAGFYPARR